MTFLIYFADFQNKQDMRKFKVRKQNFYKYSSTGVRIMSLWKYTLKPRIFQNPRNVLKMQGGRFMP